MMTDLKITHVGGKETMIVLYDGLLDNHICETLLGVLKSDYPKNSFEGLMASGFMPNVKLSSDLHFSALKYKEKNADFTNVHFDLEQSIHQAMSSCLAHYMSEYEVQTRMFDDINDTGFQVQKYIRNYGYFRTHVDSFPGQSVSNRVISVLLYLNTIEHGGETNFPLHNQEVKPIAGRIVLFPATFTHPHESRPALSEDKWIINTFITNTVSQIDNPSIDVIASFNNEVHDHIHDEEDELSHSHDNTTYVDEF